MRNWIWALACLEACSSSYPDFDHARHELVLAECDLADRCHLAYSSQKGEACRDGAFVRVYGRMGNTCTDDDLRSCADDIRSLPCDSVIASVPLADITRFSKRCAACWSGL